MSYQVIARKWRPQKFDEIVGQEHITTTLKNSIAGGRIGHAFLFTGIRGVGKTTAARILAKALNCDHGPATEPCNQCPACIEITQGSALDVKEIDGASNRGVDNIQDLREGVAFSPARDRYKIYIIDEIHMLTREAFNALLKTLEEPPAHVVFIFATTELHKVPQTIASRCQVFEFKRIPLASLVTRLKAIVEAEGIEVSDDAVRLVAREADGSLRDASSLMDQVISFSGGRIDTVAVGEVLRTGSRAMATRALAAILSEDPAEALRTFQDVCDRGITAKQFLHDLARFLAECLKVMLLGREAMRETGLTDAEVSEMTALAGDRPPEYLATLLGLLVSSADKVADSRNPELLATSAVVRAARLSSLSSVDGMITRLEAVMSGEGPSRRPSGAIPPPRPANQVPGRPPPPSAGRQSEQEPQSQRTTPERPAAAGSSRANAAPVEVRAEREQGPANGVIAVSLDERMRALKQGASAAPPPPPRGDERARDADVLEKMRRHPVVQHVLDTFGGEVLNVRQER